MPSPRLTGTIWNNLVRNQKTKRLPCCLCGQPINYDTPWPHPDSFSVEHLRPRSTHPELTFEPTNLGSAHLRCNQSRGNRDTPPTIGTTSRNW